MVYSFNCAGRRLTIAAAPTLSFLLIGGRIQLFSVVPDTLDKFNRLVATNAMLSSEVANLATWPAATNRRSTPRRFTFRRSAPLRRTLSLAYSISVLASGRTREASAAFQSVDFTHNGECLIPPEANQSTRPLPN
jgi:hypothetical protein